MKNADKLRVWGMGANWGNKSKLKEFLENSYAGIGWLENEAPSLYEMIRDIQIGDIIYLKSFTIRNCMLNIKAIGKVKATAFTDGNYYKNTDKHITIQVKWYDVPNNEIFYDFKINVDNNNAKIDLRNNVYNNTLYREYNKKIITMLEPFIVEH